MGASKMTTEEWLEETEEWLEEAVKLKEWLEEVVKLVIEYDNKQMHKPMNSRIPKNYDSEVFFLHHGQNFGEKTFKTQDGLRLKVHDVVEGPYGEVYDGSNLDSVCEISYKGRTHFVKFSGRYSSWGCSEIYLDDAEVVRPFRKTITIDTWVPVDDR